MLQLGQLRHHIEFWIPSAARRDIRQISLPRPLVRPVEEVPLFGWARNEEVVYWLNLIDAQKSGDARKILKASDVDNNGWAISGMADLGDALSWAALSIKKSERDR